MTIHTLGRVALVAVCLVVGLVSTGDAQTGSIKGKFVLKGDVPEPKKLTVTKDQEVCAKQALYDESLVVDPKSKGIKNVVIYCRERRVDVTPAAKEALKDTVQIDNNCCRFEPHIVVLTVDQTLEILNSDAVAHNAAISPLADTAINPLIPPNGKYPHKFRRAQRVPQPVSCSIHPWMVGYVLPLSNPYFAVTDDDGSFEIKNLPAGEKLEFQVWQERKGYFEAKSDWKNGRFEVTVPDGGVEDLGTIEVPASLFAE